jgi:predicted permease
MAISANVFAATAAIAIAAVFFVGLMPAILAGRTDAVAAIKDDSGSGGGRRSRARLVLVTGQMAASVLLLIGAALLLQSVWNINRGANFDPRYVATVRLRPSLVDYTRERAYAFQRSAIAAIEAVPGVVSASPSVYMSMLAGGGNVGVSRDPAAPADARTPVMVGHTGANYFKTLGVPLIEGRDFSDHDTLDAPRVAIVNEVLARQLWPSTSPVGETVYVNGQPLTVIAVARDAQFYSSGEPVRTQIFLSYWQPLSADPFVNDARMIVRTSGDPAALMAPIRRAIAAVDAAVPVNEDQPLTERVSYTYQTVRFARTMMVGFAILALVLSAVGVYGVLAFSVSQRTRELAIRSALGATRGEVASLVLRDAVTMIAVGVTIGVGAAWMSSHFIATFLYGIDPRNLAAFVVGPIVLVAVSFVASFAPVRRAAAVSASTALRYE